MPVVPQATYDTAATIVGLGSQLNALRCEREQSVSTYLAFARTFLEEGRQAELVQTLEAFKIIYGAGWQKRATEAGLPKLQKARADLLGVYNDGQGRWVGEYPLALDAVRPPAKRWVVYQLFKDTTLIYIGSTSDFTTRLYAHSRTKEFNAWRAAECQSEHECRALEAALIDRDRPPLNRMIATPKVALR